MNILPPVRPQRPAASVIPALPWIMSADGSRWTAPLPGGQTALIERRDDGQSFRPRVGDVIGPVCTNVVEAATWAYYCPCPDWCAGGDPGHEHVGKIILDDGTGLVIGRSPTGEITADIVGEPSEIAEHGSVALSAAALARLASIAATL